MSHKPLDEYCSFISLFLFWFLYSHFPSVSPSHLLCSLITSWWVTSPQPLQQCWCPPDVLLFVNEIVRQQHRLCCSTQSIDHMLCIPNFGLPVVHRLSWTFNLKCAVTCWLINQKNVWRYEPKNLQSLLNHWKHWVWMDECGSSKKSGACWQWKCCLTSLLNIKGKIDIIIPACLIKMYLHILHPKLKLKKVLKL